MRTALAVAGVPVSVRTVIPSLTYRSGVHPLTSIAESIGLVVDSVLVPGSEARCDRNVNAGKFTVDLAADVAGRHVLVIDDVWTTGSNAQSAALTLRRAGAAAVSVFDYRPVVEPSKQADAEVHPAPARRSVRLSCLSRDGRRLSVSYADGVAAMGGYRTELTKGEHAAAAILGQMDARPHTDGGGSLQCLLGAEPPAGASSAERFELGVVAAFGPPVGIGQAWRLGGATSTGTSTNSWAPNRPRLRTGTRTVLGASSSSSVVGAVIAAYPVLLCRRALWGTPRCPMSW